MIAINIDKARAIGHDIRRALREQEFAPHDAVISKQLPGASTAEQAREEIREKYAAVQNQIDAAGSADEIKQALGLS